MIPVSESKVSMGMAKKTGEKKRKGGTGLPAQKAKTDAGSGEEESLELEGCYFSSVNDGQCHTVIV